jgi:hypothetical protein
MEKEYKMLVLMTYVPDDDYVDENPLKVLRADEVLKFMLESRKWKVYWDDSYAELAVFSLPEMNVDLTQFSNTRRGKQYWLGYFSYDPVVEQIQFRESDSTGVIYEVTSYKITDKRPRGS